MYIYFCVNDLLIITFAFCNISGKMAQMEQQLPLQMPDLSSLRITTAVSMLGKAYGCGQCSGKFNFHNCIIILRHQIFSLLF